MGINVLSLFDGISCGQVALQRAGIEVDNYYASEIDKYAIKITQKNFPNTIQLGNVVNINSESLPKIDLLIGGSPCQDLSNYKYDRGEVKGLDGKKSSLFFHFVRLLRETKPKYFLLENVASMEKKWIDVISKELGVEPIMINSSLVCAAERKRLYWTNIPNVTQPENKSICLKDIIIETVPEKYWYNKYSVTYNGKDKKVEATLNLNGHRQAKEVYNLKFKSNTLLCDGNGGNLVKKVYQNGKVRKLTPIEYERLQTLPDNYTDGVSDSKRYSAIGNGWTVDVIAHILNKIKESERQGLWNTTTGVSHLKVSE
jgi:DNA (cytosine-5)-methyltransferase 3A